MKKKIIVFTGLSISHEEAREILEADYRAPVKRNDILKAIEEKPDIIGIIDGVFHQSPSVSHKEIMKAIDKGIAVIGGSSMGALRASELDTLGMIGIGYVYKEYANGNIQSDDDVAIVFDSKTNKPISEALVNISYNLKKAIDEKIISEIEEKEILKIAKSLYYPYRTYETILKKTDINENLKNDLIDFLNNTIDIKKQDAEEVLNYIKKIK